MVTEPATFFTPSASALLYSVQLAGSSFDFVFILLHVSAQEVRTQIINCWSTFVHGQ